MFKLYSHFLGQQILFNVVSGSTEITGNQEDKVGSSSKVNVVAAKDLVSSLTPSVAPELATPENVNQRIDNAMKENMGSSTSVASSFRELWDTLLSHGKSHRQFSLYLAVAIVALLILMQVW